MKLTIDNKTYILDTERAIKLEILKEEIPVNISLTPDEATVLYSICGRIGGEPTGTRGCCDSIRRKLFALNIKLNSIDCSMDKTYNQIYFKKVIDK